MATTDLIYVHELGRLNPKSAEIEATGMVRELRKQANYPLTDEQFRSHLNPLYVTPAQRAQFVQQLSVVEQARQYVTALMQTPDTLFEPINMHRALTLLAEVPESMTNNINYFDQMIASQDIILGEAMATLNALPKMRTRAEVSAAHARVQDLIQAILRSQNVMEFSYQDIIYEAHVDHMAGLSASLKKGYFFHILVEEELKKLDFSVVRNRIPPPHLAASDSVNAMVDQIAADVKNAYDCNMNMVKLALWLHAYQKWLTPMM